MISRLWTAFLLSLACASTIAWLVVLMHEKNIRPVQDIVAFLKKQSKAGRIIFGSFFITMWIFASVKPNSGGNVGNLRGPVPSGEITITSTNTTRTITAEDFARGFVMSRVGTDEAFDFSAPSNAVVCADWRAFGAATDWIYESVNWKVESGKWGTGNGEEGTGNGEWGTGGQTRLRIHSDGWVEVKDGPVFSPFKAVLGIVPEANWHLIGNGEQGTGNGGESQFWHFVTPSNTLQVTWQNALYGRDTNTPVSVQAEFWTDGRFTYRYDLSRCGGRGATALPEGCEGVITNITIGASFAGNEWTTNAIPTNVTSITFYPLSEEDVTNQDRDNDGLSLVDELFVYGTDPMLPDSDFDGVSDGMEIALGTNPAGRDSDNDSLVDGSDPDPTATTPLDDRDGDGIPDAYENHWFGDTNVVDSLDGYGANGFSLGFELASGITPTNDAETAFMPTNRIAAWKITDGFVAHMDGSSGNIYERTFRIARNGGWEQFFVSSKPDRAGGWRLDGLALDWEDSRGGVGSATASPAADSLYLPVSTNSPATLTLRLRLTATSTACRSPLYLLAYSPSVEVAGAQRVATTNAEWTVTTVRDEETELAASIDRSERPCNATLHPDEADAEFVDGGGKLRLRADGTLLVKAPGVHALPSIGTNSCRLACLCPGVSYGGGHHSSGSGLDYDPESGTYSETCEYPLDSGCLWRSWHSDSSGGYACDCEPEVSVGFDIDDYPDIATNVAVNGETATGTVSVGGESVWSGTATHDVSTAGGMEEKELLSDDGCGECGGCEDGNCDALEGGELGSLKFRIPLGQPRKGQVSGFAWFLTDEPLAIGVNTLQVIKRGDAQVTDSPSGSGRTVVCGDNRGRTLAMQPVAGGIEVTVTETASGKLEHTWRILNVNGSPSRIRLWKVSRLDNTMSDDTYVYESGGWTKFDNISQTSEEFAATGDINEDGLKREERILRDAGGAILSHTVTETERFGSFANAVIRETYHAEKSWGDNWNESFASYYTDNDSPKRNGKARLVWGNARAWQFCAYDVEGRVTLTLDQYDGSLCPDWILGYMDADAFDGQDVLQWLGGQWFAAIATIFDYTPLVGDAAAAEDADKPRTVSRYLVGCGTVTLIGRTWTRYTHGAANGYATVTEETIAAGAQNAAISDARNARRIETRYDGDAPGIPLMLRGATVESIDEDGILEQNTYSISNGVLSQTSQKSYMSQPFPVATASERCTTYGNVIREWSVHVASGIAFDEKRHLYDDKNRLISTRYADGSSTTNAYSCCRLLWSRDRTGRRVLRSAVTGQDHLYYAMEEVSLAELPHDDRYVPYDMWESDYGSYRVTQHFMDALGRETNAVVRTCKSQGAAVSPTWSCRGWRTSESTSFPYGVSGYEVSADMRGNATTTIHTSFDDCEVVETTETNKTTTATTYRNDSSVVREEWSDGTWRETVQTNGYDAAGCRVEATVVSASDHAAVTARTICRDFLGRMVREVRPMSDVAYTYDGASPRVLSATDSISGETVTRLYNDLGEAVGQVKNGVTNRTDTTYVVSSNVLWRVTTQTEAASVTNLCAVTQERLTGLSDGLRSETFESRNGALALHTHSSFDPTNAILTEVSESATSGTTTTKSKYGVVIETTTDGGTTSNFFDPYGRVFYTEKDGRSVDWIGRNGYGDVEEYDVFYAWRDNVYAEFYDYDIFGNRIAATNALGAVTTSAYDSANRLAESGGATYPVRYAYDTDGRRTGLFTTRNGNAWDATGWTFDPATGFCTVKTYADNSTVTYTHTPDGLLLRETKSSGAWKENVYDATRQIVGVVSSDGAQDAAIRRDEFGRVMAESNSVAREEYSLDDCWGATNETQTVDGVSVSFERGFDAYGRIERFTRIGGEESMFGYVPHGAIYTVSNGNVAVEYAFTGDALDAGYALAVQGGLDYSREVFRHGYLRSCIVAVSNHCGNVSQGLEYSYDALQRPVSRNSDSFGYNVRGEVVFSRRDAENAEETYSYDNIGNLVSNTFDAITNIYFSNSRNQYTSNLCASASLREINYDLDGNMTRHGEWTYAYDSGNRLVSVASNGITVATMSYDTQGRRVQKVAADGTHRYFYDGWLLVYEHVVRPNNTTNEIEYVWGKDVSGTRDGAAGIGGLLYQKRDGAIYVPWYDAYGNILGYRDAQGNVVASYTYDAFGNIINQSGTMADTFSFRFSTKYFDADCGLYYYGYRHYKPQIMRWLTEDPAGLNGGMNMYLFCSNAAIYKSDTDGRWEWPWIPDWTEERARQEVRAKIQEMRENGYDFAADALGHYLRNTAQNIDLSRYSDEISRHHEWRESFLSSVLKQLKTRDPRGTDKKVEIGDVAHKASFNADLQNGNILDMFTTQFSHRFYPTESMGLFYALYGSYYSYVGTASWCRRNQSTMFIDDERTSIEFDLQVASYDMLSYGGGFPRTTFPSYSAAQYLQKNHNYNTPFIYLRWTEKGAWEISDWHTLHSNGIQYRKLK